MLMHSTKPFFEATWEVMLASAALLIRIFGFKNPGLGKKRTTFLNSHDIRFSIKPEFKS